MRYIVIFLVWLVIFLGRYGNSFQAMGNLQQSAGKEIEVKGRISSEPMIQGLSQKFRVGRVKVWTKSYPRWHYGDKVKLTGKLEEKIINQWYSQFSLNYPVMEMLEIGDVNKGWRRRLLGWRQKIEGIYSRLLPEPEASLLAGIVLGAKRDFGKKFWQNLQRTGTLHIVVASGYNVTVVIGTIIGYLAGWVKRRTAVLIGILAVIGYTVMAGAEAAIVRAAIMGSLAYFGQVLGRKADGIRLLMLAGGVMLWWEPLLLWDVGWQLSIMATAGLLFISPLLGKVFNKVWVVGKDMSETVSAQIAVWPILVITFGSLSVFAVVVNSLILWMVPIIMGLGMILAGIGLVINWIGIGWGVVKVLSWSVYLPLTIMVRIVEWFGGQAWMSYQIEGVNWWWGIVYYLFVVLQIGIWSYDRSAKSTSVEFHE